MIIIFIRSELETKLLVPVREMRTYRMRPDEHYVCDKGFIKLEKLSGSRFMKRRDEGDPSTHWLSWIARCYLYSLYIHIFWKKKKMFLLFSKRLWCRLISTIYNHISIEFLQCVTISKKLLLCIRYCFNNIYIFFSCMQIKLLKFSKR